MKSKKKLFKALGLMAIGGITALVIYFMANFFLFQSHIKKADIGILNEKTDQKILFELGSLIELKGIDKYLVPLKKRKKSAASSSYHPTYYTWKYLLIDTVKKKKHWIKKIDPKKYYHRQIQIPTTSSSHLLFVMGDEPVEKYSKNKGPEDVVLYNIKTRKQTLVLKGITSLIDFKTLGTNDLILLYSQDEKSFLGFFNLETEVMTKSEVVPDFDV